MIDARKRILEVFSDIGKLLLQETTAQSYELVNLHDIHGFYRLGGNLALHVQGYPGMSRDDAMFVSMRLRDYERMMRIRASGGVSLGNEHEANLPDVLGWNLGMYMLYDASQLFTRIDQDVKKFLAGGLR